MNCLISAGPTREWIDPVRFLSNPSSGKMGYALARAAVDRGMQVTLVSGPTALKAPAGAEVLFVETAREMQEAMSQRFAKADLIIMAAAVSDHRPETRSKQKQKKEQMRMTLDLVANPDILMELGKQKKNGQTLVGFAAETENLLPNARRKLREKNLDWIVANDVSEKDRGFQSDFNKISLLSKEQNEMDFEYQEKNSLARKIMDILCP
ncbi:MAG: phosphopantothenoylcysteine decarboxylase [Verrucomicrobiota bacterium]|nr:phosphopantothenoylcysteine decarboxylase [Verrucomicrobiota bacterium]MEC7627606.1 phosphopantothenoylcysteine decarboxylase [Verrucomicrobiota bacterium]MEC8656517.1 phosphopantothenoylcysteine decarboxylase [Verrucomicrobiota bacterium]MEC8865740.1 phosphopantothenoylcysteine decarboxylase [Verrucomicrobiota bacterium]